MDGVERVTFRNEWRTCCFRVWISCKKCTSCVLLLNEGMENNGLNYWKGWLCNDREIYWQQSLARGR
jgi:hypothetical protein